VLACALCGLASGHPPPAARGAAVAAPNVLIFVTDDQSRLTVTADVMPAVHQFMVAEGRSYPNFTVSDPLCCPSRASIMTGRLNHNNGVLSNDVITPRRLDLGSTIQCYLLRGGYRTSLYGKYLNHYPISRALPCLNDFAYHTGGNHTDLRFNTNGVVSTPPGYGDDYALDRFLAHLDQTEEVDTQPWFTYFATTYPHSPYTPRPEHEHDVIAPPPGTQGPALHETDISDKPSFIQAHAGPRGVNQTLDNELKMLRTVDDEFARIIAKLRANDELSNTLIFFVSDNGYLFGEHQLCCKSLPYWESINVPFFVRWPGHIPPGSTDTRFAENIDIAPTIINASGVTTKRLYPYDGRSLLRDWARPFIFNESFHIADGDPRNWQPSWRSLRTARYQYIEWLRQRRRNIIAREFYDLTADPYQLDNLLGDGNPSNDPPASLQKTLHARLMAASFCAGRTCP
jgi:arylsulfatase A-like enzyme